MPDPNPPITAELTWSDALRFGARSGASAIVVDGDMQAGPSPMQLVAMGVAGCMAADVVSILQRGRHAVTGLRVSFSGDRLPAPPRRFTAIALHFHVTGDVPDDAVRRAIDLSHEKYCSASNSLRQDIVFTTAFTVVAG